VLKTALTKKFINFSREAEKGRTFRVEKDKRDKLVDVLCFCWMSNHIHFADDQQL